MTTTDEHGNKLPQTKINKKDFSRMIREFRMQNKSRKHCDMCGFKVRTSNHKLGKHHQQVPKVIKEALKTA